MTARLARTTAAGDLGAVAAAAGIAGALGAAALALFPTPAQSGPGEATVRALLVLTVAGGLLLAPGLALAAAGRLEQLGGVLVPLPGLIVLAAGGVVTWLLATITNPRLGAASVSVAIGLASAAAGLWVRRRDRRPVPAELRFCLAVLVALGLLATGRSLWSVDVPGGLYTGTISRTLEAADRPDSRIPYHVIQLAAHGANPWSPAARANFFPYGFGDRGPLAALVATPVVLVSASGVPSALPEAPWQPFDPEGFTSFRIVMACLAAALLWPVYALGAHFGGERAGRTALAIAAGSPFTANEVLYTWPKLAAGGLVVAAAVLLLRRSPVLAGAAFGAAYLMHSLALLWLLPLVVVSLVADRRARPAVLFAAASLVAVVAWRLMTLHSAYANFFVYPFQAFARDATGPGDWIASRVDSLASTLLPGYVYHFHATDPHVNAIGHQSPRLVRWFFQYWTTLPLSVGLLFSPFLLWRILQALRRRPVLVTVAVLLPFLLFWLYWGSYTSGMMREGLHPLFLTLAAVFGCAAVRIRLLERLAIVSRAPETAALLLLPAAAGSGRLATPDHALTDGIGLALVIAAVAAIGVLAWRATAPDLTRRV